MSQATQILGISGSLRQASFNTAALRAAQELAPDGVTIEIASLADIPLYNQDQRDKSVPAAVEKLCKQVMEADALLFASPEYNYSVSGVLKNAIDWLSRLKPQPFAGKPAAVFGASMGLIGTARAQYDLRKIMVSLDVHFLNKPEVMIAQAHERFDASGKLTHEPTRELTQKLIQSLTDWTAQLKAGASKA
jgi:chromate reductase, NAD(P)H dehydrogenase (quinone)